MLVSEIFRSIQGESTHMGLSCVFIRLAGCNLKCGWCDTAYAQGKEKAKKFTIDQIVKEVKKYKCALLEITGGEPLMQDEARPLASRLLDAGFKVLLETNGTVCLSKLDPRLIKIVDVKCPSSGHAGSFL
ncbi:MAG: radical SAM protein, partial [Deltaproteobacteria bacterium]